MSCSVKEFALQKLAVEPPKILFSATWSHWTAKACNHLINDK